MCLPFCSVSKCCRRSGIFKSCLKKDSLEEQNIPDTFRGSETASKQLGLCHIPEPWSYVHGIVAFAKLKCSCTEESVVCVGQVCLGSVGEMIAFHV